MGNIKSKSYPIILLFLLLANCSAFSQSFLKTQGKNIVDEDNNPIILRGMGLGGWMVQEGYMLQTAAFASPQHKIRQIITEVIGEEATEDFYAAWLSNHMRRVDVDSLKSWGFNSVRLPMHYNLYTLPIEEEPVAGENTWLEKGFELTDSLIAWCKANEMYVVLDLHAAPGGQGYDAAISDYDDTKPSLWESAENRAKTVALWKRLAERYKDEPVVAGYDLLNEVNWDLPGGALLRSLYGQITDAIREVDTNHIIFIEGNWFANDFTGLTPPWDDNMVYSPHKYWSTNDQGSIQWVLDLRNTYNVPLYLGESGENSNVWFRDAIELLEDNNIGWAWWPMKKVEAIAGPLSIIKNSGYQALLDYWSGAGSQPSVESATSALMELTEGLKIENCIYQKDVIDAMFRQVATSETVPFKHHIIPGIIHASDFDLGTNGDAYMDDDVATYHVSTGNFTTWNTGWTYRNDGVDIERSMDDQITNGFNVGWTNKGEWMQYTVQVEEEGAYDILVRTAGGASGGEIQFADEGVDLSAGTSIPFSGGYQEWETTVIEDIILTAGEHKIKCYIDESGYNIGSFEFVRTGDIASIETSFVSGETRKKDELQLFINKTLDPNSEVDEDDFSVLVNGAVFTPSLVEIDQMDSRIIRIHLDVDLVFSQTIRASYSGNTIKAIDGTDLSTFSSELIENTLPFYVTLPAKIEAEDYVFQTGIQLESTTDAGGGQNIGYLDVGDYANYRVYIPEAGRYQVSFRTAAESQVGEVRLDFINEFNGIVASRTTSFSSTGGWQNWETTTDEIDVPTGYYIMRMTITKPSFNMNWMDFAFLTSTENELGLSGLSIYPNPGEGLFFIKEAINTDKKVSIEIHDIDGRLVFKENGLYKDQLKNYKIDLFSEPKGMYVVSLLSQQEGVILQRKKIVKF